MARYNRTTVNNPDVRYFSWAGRTEFPTAIFVLVILYSAFEWPFGLIDNAVQSFHLAESLGRLMGWSTSQVQHGTMI